jgi:hypothetical protein
MALGNTDIRPLLALLSMAVVRCTFTPVLPGDGGGADARGAGDAAETTSAPDTADVVGGSLEVGVDAGGAGPPRAPDAPTAPDAQLECQPGQKMACYGGPAGTGEVGACHGGERSCLSGGSWSDCQGEQRPAAEQCNGADDDCDGTVDDGCPKHGALLRTEQIPPPSPVLGSLALPRAVTFIDSCPQGQAIVGLTGNYGSGIDSLGVRCGSLQGHEDRSVRPYRYELAVAPGQEFIPRGGTGGMPNGIDPRMRCPANEVLVGLSGWVDPDAPESCPTNYCPFTGTLCRSLYGLTISCAPYELRGSPGNFTVVRSSAPHQVSQRIGVVGGVGEVENPYACPGEGVMYELKGAFGVWPLDCRSTVINGLQVTCSSASAPLIGEP